MLLGWYTAGLPKGPICQREPLSEWSTRPEPADPRIPKCVKCKKNEKIRKIENLKILKCQNPTKTVPGGGGVCVNFPKLSSTDPDSHHSPITWRNSKVKFGKLRTCRQFKQNDNNLSEVPQWAFRCGLRNGVSISESEAPRGIRNLNAPRS